VIHNWFIDPPPLPFQHQLELCKQHQKDLAFKEDDEELSEEARKIKEDARVREDMADMGFG
jgi:hypothetical protein